jgi:hypothetical protein
MVLNNGPESKHEGAAHSLEGVVFNNLTATNNALSFTYAAPTG